MIAVSKLNFRPHLKLLYMWNLLGDSHRLAVWLSLPMAHFPTCTTYCLWVQPGSTSSLGSWTLDHENSLLLGPTNHTDT
eukprot:scaffold22969_cov89-Cyclotella_meneghiniana.AAC.1